MADEQMEEAALGSLDAEGYEAIIAALSPTERLVAKLRFGWGLSAREICGLREGVTEHLTQLVVGEVSYFGVAPHDPFRVRVKANEPQNRVCAADEVEETPTQRRE